MGIFGRRDYEAEMIRCKTLVYQYQDRMENASEEQARKQRELEECYAIAATSESAIEVNRASEKGAILETEVAGLGKTIATYAELVQFLVNKIAMLRDAQTGNQVTGELREAKARVFGDPRNDIAAANAGIQAILDQHHATGSTTRVGAQAISRRGQEFKERAQQRFTTGAATLGAPHEEPYSVRVGAVNGDHGGLL
jgi:hypothetical protein